MLEKRRPSEIDGECHVDALFSGSPERIIECPRNDLDFRARVLPGLKLPTIRRIGAGILLLAGSAGVDAYPRELTDALLGKALPGQMAGEGQRLDVAVDA
jgi:hypothetical protein